LAVKSDPVVKHHTAKQLKTYVYGALAGTPAAAYVTAKIAPKAKVVTFAMLAPAVLALETGVIDALAIDTPTGNYLATTQLLANNGTQIATQVGQFASNGDEYYALLLQKSSPIAGCVDVALASLNNQGTIAHLQKLWLKVYATIPTIKP
jgi:polar amino acid transport system substrate-binding protein